MEQPKEKMIRSKKMKEAARGQTCTMQIHGVCNHNTETTVFAHSNRMAHGKGFGEKAHDIFGADMCSACHDLYDGRTQKTEWTVDALWFRFEEAMAKTQLRRIKQGILVVK